MATTGKVAEPNTELRELWWHLRRSGYVQRERPAATIPARIAELRTGLWGQQPRPFRKDAEERRWQMSWDAEGALLLQPMLAA